MRILAFSDLHRDANAARVILEQSREADVVVGAGDFATRGVGLDDTISILRDLTVPAVFVAGNHECPEDLKLAFHGNHGVHVLHGYDVLINGVRFFGLGGEIPCNEDFSWNHGISEEAAELFLRKCPPNAVLVTHSPPFGIADVQREGRHDGSRAVRNALVKSSPRLHFCGHVHHSWGRSGVISNCSVHNLGPTVNWFSLS
ncbi:metallophosphoesterase [Ensifer sp. ENS04]|nr:metallophosphoesterase [Ensifer sp. ENS04]